MIEPPDKDAALRAFRQTQVWLVVFGPVALWAVSDAPLVTLPKVLWVLTLLCGLGLSCCSLWAALQHDKKPLALFAASLPPLLCCLHLWAWNSLCAVKAAPQIARCAAIAHKIEAAPPGKRSEFGSRQVVFGDTLPLCLFFEPKQIQPNLWQVLVYAPSGTIEGNSICSFLRRERVWVTPLGGPWYSVYFGDKSVWKNALKRLH